MDDFEFKECLKEGGHLDHPILKKHIDLLKKIAVDSRTMCVCQNTDKNGFFMMECCDNWYTHSLTKEDCIELSELFRELSEAIN